MTTDYSAAAAVIVQALALLVYALFVAYLFIGAYRYTAADSDGKRAAAVKHTRYTLLGGALAGVALAAAEIARRGALAEYLP